MVVIQGQLLHLTDALPDDLPPLLDLPLTLEQGCAASTHTTTEEEEEEETDEISGLSEDMQRYQFTEMSSLNTQTHFEFRKHLHQFDST